MKRCRVIAPHKATYADTIVLSKGEAASAGRTDPENPGWIWCVCDSGKSGWVPLAYLKLEGDKATALFDYNAMELTVEIGAALSVVREESSWALCETDSGEQGWIPLKCLEPAS